MYFPTADIDVSPFVPPLMAFAVSFFSSMGGLSGAFLLLPLLMTFLGYTNPSVSATNQLYNVFSSPGGIFRYCREGRLLWPLSWIIIAGAVPGVVAGGFIRLHWLAQVRPFKLFVALVLFGIALEMLYDLLGRRRAAPAPACGAPGMARPVVEVTQSSLSRVAYTFSGRLHAFSVPAVCACSVAVGLVGGIYGIGGGAIIAPFLVSMFRLPIHTVAGATLMATFVNALGGPFLCRRFALLPRPQRRPRLGLGRPAQPWRAHRYVLRGALSKAGSPGAVEVDARSHPFGHGGRLWCRIVGRLGLFRR